ncbi:MAG: hypothetical protein WA865_20750 [Spirulinaceae cyanobacterium]
MNDFEREIAKIPSNQKCFKVYERKDKDSLNICYFGVPSDEQFGRQKLESIPNSANCFCLHLGGEQEKLIQAFVESDYS